MLLNYIDQFIKYYEKTWLNANFIRFDIEYDRINKSSINSVCGGFHSFLNRQLM